MKKVININFQGRVIPIEESAYDILKQYVESLRNFFANEEGRDEIINDIEGRIAELFGETLKKGATCIVDDDVHNIIASMGRPEDFEAEEEHVKSQLGGEQKQSSQGQQSSSSQQQQQSYAHSDGSKLYRDENHKILGGVCSGLANYFNTDPIVMRVLAVVFFGIFFIPYLVLWVAVPGTSSVVIGSQRKRLYRDPEEKFIAGVCSGLSQYFGVNVWIPRLLFAIPFLSFVFHWGNWGFWDFPHFISLSFSPGAIFVYVILWLVLPEAKTSAERLEMKGEKVDLNTIKNTIQGDLEGFPKRAQEYGRELRDKGQQWSKEHGADATYAARRATRSIGDVIALIAKIFAYFILGTVLFVVVCVLFGLGIFFTGMLPLKGYLIGAGAENIYAWGTLILFIWVPVIGIVTLIIRRLGKMRGNRNLVRYSFLSLWLIGLFCFIALICSLRDDFRYTNDPIEQEVTLTNPTVNKLEITAGTFAKHYHRGWFRMEPFSGTDEDTVYVPNMGVKIVKSGNDSFKVSVEKFANGATRQEATNLAQKIHFNGVQTDSVLNFDKGIAITRAEKFRNQEVLVTVAVPVGKRIIIDERMRWQNVHMGFNNSGAGYSWEWYNDDNDTRWSYGIEYVMNAKGKLERVDKKNDDDETNDDEDDNTSSKSKLEQYQKSREKLQKELEQKQKEADEIKKELEKPLVDSVKKK
jgi:phage shock protein PspC (stress-responsive transcriptional regulator)